MNIPNIPPLTPRESMALSGDQALMGLARRAICDFAKSVGGLSPQPVIALARQQFPGLADAEALSELSSLVGRWVGAVVNNGVLAGAAADAEHKRLGPLRNAAAARMFAAMGKVESIPKALKISESLAKEKRKQLKALGVTDAEALEIAAPFPDRAQADAESAALQAEAEVIGEFLRTGDESKLPAGIAMPLAVTVPGPGAPKPSKAAALMDEGMAALSAVAARRSKGASK